MSDFEKFNEELPRKEKFYSSLTDKDYHDLYSKLEVLLLVDVFEKCFNTHTYNLSFIHSLVVVVVVVFGSVCGGVGGGGWGGGIRKEKARFEVVHWLACISTEGG